jgi:hypothetical protein
MTSISKDEYQRYLEELTDQQYADNDDADFYSPPEEAWIPAESEAKERMNFVNRNGSIDVTKFRKEKIQEALYKCINIVCGVFLIRINKYHGSPDKFGKGTNLSMDISLAETKFKTATGQPCNMQFRMNLTNDNRFTNRPWLHYFSAYGRGTNVPVEVVVDIIRWLQALKRMNAFL